MLKLKRLWLLAGISEIAFSQFSVKYQNKINIINFNIIKSQENFNIAAYHFAKITFVPPQHSFRRLNFKPLLLYIHV